jgi:hypothetical protein
MLAVAPPDVVAGSAAADTKGALLPLASSVLGTSPPSIFRNCSHSWMSASIWCSPVIESSAIGAAAQVEIT